MIARRILTETTTQPGPTRTQKDIEERLTVNLGSYYVESVEEVSGALKCGAQSSVTFERRDGKKLETHGTIISFSIFQGEDGQAVTMAQLEAQRLLVELTMLPTPGEE